MNVLAVDIGGTHVKLLAKGQKDQKELKMQIGELTINIEQPVYLRKHFCQDGA